MPVDQFLLTATLRATAILVAACGLALVLSRCRSSAATRHKLWALTLGSSLAVPLIIALLPAWRVSLPWASNYPLTSSLLASSPDNPPPHPTQSIYLLASAESPRNTPAQSPPESNALSSEPDSANSPGAEPLAPAATHSPIRITTWLIAAWCLGAFLTVSPLPLGFLSLRHLKKSSQAVADSRLLAALRHAARQLGINPSIQLLLSPARAMPMTWGTWRPTILLPTSAESWTDQRMQAVLLHELAHVVRRDCLWQMVAQLARAMYWFHPLAWLAERQLRIEQERACDDLVLSHNFDPPDYADHLLAISASCSPCSGSAVVLAMSHSSMSNPSNLESRLMAILNPRLNRSAPSRHFARFMAASALTATVLISATRFEAVAANDTAAEQNANQNQPAPIAQSDSSKALAELRTKIAEQSAKPINDNEIMRGAIKGMVESLRDPYADYFTPEALAKLEQQISGSLVGIGAQLEMHDKQVRVVTPLPGSPALKAGLQPGDTILEIAGQPTAGLELSEVIKRIVGAAGSNIRLTIGREGNQKVELNVTRGPINLPTVRAFRATAANEPDFLLDMVHKIGYIQIDQFTSATAKDTRAALESLRAVGLKGLILDLRNCPGGLLDSAVAVARLFLSEGTIVSIHRPTEKTEIKADVPALAGDFPLILLVNGQTASAAEVLIGALHDNQRAQVLGTRTLGKGSIQSLIKLDSENGAVKLTTSEYRLPSGRSIDKRPGEKTWGIDPDEGFFVPLDHQQSKAMMQRRLQRQVIGTKAAADGNRAPSLTPALLEEQESDPQLAAALKALTARIQSGSFAKINSLTAAQAQQLVHRAEIEHRRETAAKALEQLDRELSELN